MIKMKDVCKTYDNGVSALNEINIEIDRGEFVYIVGPSGAGKSTFIRLVVREVKPTKGTIYVNDVNVNELKEKKVPLLRRDIGVVYQDFKLLSKLTVYENVAFAMEVIESPPALIRTRVMEVLDLVGLKHKARSLPQELSGGEQQRVSIARAIVNNPKIVIADEPTGNLDPDTSWGIMKVLQEINDRGTTVIMATHSKEIVNTFKNRVIAIENGVIVRDEHRGEYGYEV
ncbi:cell division ATP-binding protein FtsE [Virgibacillus pantothenticus]|uniref:Cell division ATP-binding protein FtsE n=1 Tax=Virgibacillus pantothenticus TaxID=1473 RepID=A0A0L0QME3_VIRPA|nr:MULTISPECIES: cell division ATP-binding protein FtsE [Virgibacillus]API93455.1 cell division ATP-binding protein FtsE [Virgibacillus sp. 6R]KNE19772.1 cell division protein FtsE [Virgibacillus pantothenticus]MBS7430162.1 cell division ATP-binding protein FtsE [Virgibacillus sp. 19R1-5]MBU8566280.1 cell division ATP-binding protein FtsE [Virgibacillus pantothenticus]MBU8600704.1 cell division ATP-binding protein FtsE [Virgibacillus pantothenticus]